MHREHKKPPKTYYSSDLRKSHVSASQTSDLEDLALASYNSWPKEHHEDSRDSDDSNAGFEAEPKTTHRSSDPEKLCPEKPQNGHRVDNNNTSGYDRRAKPFIRRSRPESKRPEPGSKSEQTGP